jgi:hypothetical protein
MAKSYHFLLHPEIPLPEAHESLLVALQTMEDHVGEEQVRAESPYSFDAWSRTCSIRVDTEIGQRVCLTFAHLLVEQFGGNAFDACMCQTPPQKPQSVESIADAVGYLLESPPPPAPKRQPAGACRPTAHLVEAIIRVPRDQM